MRIELALHPDDGSRLRRLKQLVPASAGSRSQPLRIVWHDTPDRALLHRGLALAEQRGAWHLEHLTPRTAAWPPGAPPPRLEEAARLDAFTVPLPEPLAPVAAFAGRQASFLLPVEEETVTLVLQRGVLRAVARETPVCRLLLQGTDDAVLAAARTLAQTLRLSVPRASLAAEALATADGSPPPRAPSARQCCQPA